MSKELLQMIAAGMVLPMILLIILLVMLNGCIHKGTVIEYDYRMRAERPDDRERAISIHDEIRFKSVLWRKAHNGLSGFPQEVND